ncbi:hypothetical protein FISHEDRAFT_60736 [Fistulina hepatica ATCC 64428]|uniref:BTB domain-containing protein n=1 Tax=Fistulina hepatica ATCC 64428 TaxID=1128425 RepID=A0A0D7A4F8_9AGAR|nr:hypothetical protein FISHEDRAFT_60736 [Fistulina hepatica ATCC 64428]
MSLLSCRPVSCSKENAIDTHNESGKTCTGINFANLARSDIWFLDGNIVLIAGVAAFKVHRGQLGRHSEIFHTLFSLPQPPGDSQTLFDGAPWVEIHDDPSDVFYFLSALYDGLYFSSRANDFPAMAAVLRLSTKYVVEHLRQRCLDRLIHDWPITLAGWDRREQEAAEAGKYNPREYCPHPILVIDLALELDLTSVLPAALYDLARYGPSKIMGGSTVPEVAFRPGPSSPLPSNAPRMLRLSTASLVRIFRGREAAQQFMAKFISEELQTRPPCVGCTGRSERNTGALTDCQESFYFIMLNLLRSVGGIASGRDGDPLFTLVQAHEMMSRTDFSDGQRQCGLKLCTVCREDFAQAVSKAREDAWSLMPSWFALDDGLRDMEVVRS